MQIALLLFLLFISLTMGGCSHCSRSFENEVAELIDHRIGKEVIWYADPYLQKIIEEMACNRIITVEEATQIALLNNPKIQATFEELGIAQADLVEAGLLSNPLFAGYVRFPHQSDASINTQFSVVMNFIELFLIPLRVKVAQLELEQAKARVVNEILDLAFEVQSTFYQLQAELEKKIGLENIFKISNIENELFSKQLEVANIHPLNQQVSQLHLFQTEIDLEKNQTNIISLREKLNRLMGFCKDPCWDAGLLNKECHFAISCECLEAIAYNQRMDLEEARWEVYRLASLLGLKASWTYINGKIGISTEKDAEGVRATGPIFSAEIPIFNYGQAARAKLYAQLRQAQDRLQELEIKVLSEVRESYDLIAAYTVIINSYVDQILPTQEMILESTEALYNVMGKGIFDLLERKKEHVRIHIDYAISIKDYWLAYVKLEKALGGKLFYGECE